jgi:ATP-binding cassette, subfamily B, bacterial
MSRERYSSSGVGSLRFVLKVLHLFRGYLAALVLILVVYSSTVFLKTQLIKDIVDVTVRVSSASESLWVLVGYFSGVLCIELGTFRLQEWCALKYEPVLQNHVIQSVFKHVLQREHGFFQSQLSGNLVQKINDLAACIPALVAIVLYDYLVNFLLVCVAFFSLWKVGCGLSWTIFFWALLTIAIALRIAPRSLQLANNAAETAASVSGKLVDTFDNLLTVRLFAGGNYVLKQLKGVQGRHLRASQQYRWWMLKFYMFQGVWFQLYQVVCLLLLMHLYSQHRFSAGVFAMVLSTNLIITDRLWKMFERMQELNTLWGKIGQALQILLAPPRIRDKANATSLVVHSGTIFFQRVTFGYDNASMVFCSQTVHIAARQKIGLVGYSGGGKTTFMNLIARLYDIDDGSILIDGQDIRNVTKASLHKAIAIVSQESILFHDTILANIRYGNPDANDSELMEAAKKACAHDFIVQLPHQYDTVVGPRGLNLSGGQRQRIAIARALLKASPIVLLDEVTAHLDAATAQALHTSLLAYLHEKTVLTISHKLTTLKQVDRILVFDNGKIVEDGTHEQLLEQNGHYTRLWHKGNENNSV